MIAVAVLMLHPTLEGESIAEVAKHKCPSLQLIYLYTWST